MTRFRREDLVDLGDGWARLPVPGEELFRVVLVGWGQPTPWMEERRLATLKLWDQDSYEIRCDGSRRPFEFAVHSVESMIVPGLPPSRSGPAGTSLEDAPDPRQLELPIASPD